MNETRLATLDRRFIAESFHTSPDQLRAAWVRWEAGGMGVVVDGEHVATYRSLAVGTPFFSPDGTRVAWVGQADEGWRVVVDGVEGPVVETVGEGSFAFSPDSEHLAYSLHQGARRHAVVFGREEARGEAWDATGTSIAVSSGGEHLAFAARRGDRWSVVVDGEATGDFDGVLAGTPVYGPDGRLVWAAGRGDARWVWVDGEQYGPYQDVAGDKVRFSADGEHLAYPVQRDDEWTIVIDGVEQRAWDAIGDLQWSADGRTLAYSASPRRSAFLAEWTVVVGQQEHPVGTGLLADSLAVSPDGARVAWAELADGGTAVVVDGTRYGPFDKLALGPVFSPDGHRVAFAASAGEGQAVYIDGEPGRSYHGVVGIDGAHIGWSGSDGLRYFALTADSGLVRVEERLDPE